MAELPDIGLPIFKALCDAPLAWRTPAELASAVGLDLEATLDLLSELDETGWIAVWEVEEGPLVTLSALAAERLQVRIVEVGLGQKPRWALLGEPDPPSQRSRSVFLSDHPALAQLATSPDLPPDEAVERGEGPDRRPAGSKAPVGKEIFPRPTILVGLGLSPWPSPTVEIQTPCPACGGRVLQPRMYCIYCDRSGTDLPPRDGATPVVARPARPLPSEAQLQAARSAEDARLRERRKAKHARREQAKIAEQRASARTPAAIGRGAAPSPPPGNINLGFAAPPRGPRPQAPAQTARRQARP